MHAGQVHGLTGAPPIWCTSNLVHRQSDALPMWCINAGTLPGYLWGTATVAVERLGHRAQRQPEPCNS
jgi:hypothetical protein